MDAAELPSPAEVAARGVRWAPYRTVASWYLWHAVDVRFGSAAVVGSK